MGRLGSLASLTFFSAPFLLLVAFFSFLLFVAFLLFVPFFSFLSAFFLSVFAFLSIVFFGGAGFFTTFFAAAADFFLPFAGAAAAGDEGGVVVVVVVGTSWLMVGTERSGRLVGSRRGWWVKMVKKRRARLLYGEARGATQAKPRLRACSRRSAPLRHSSPLCFGPKQKEN